MRITETRGIDVSLDCDRRGDPMGRPPFGQVEMIPIIPIPHGAAANTSVTLSEAKGLLFSRWA